MHGHLCTGNKYSQCDLYIYRNFESDKLLDDKI